MIERAASRLKEYGEVLVVTNDFAERDIVSGFGGMTSNCDNFIRTVQGTLEDLERELKNYNQKERSGYRAQ